MPRSFPGKGFTLVEVLVVVVILGVLAAIVVPQFLNAATDSRLSVLKADLHGLHVQLEMYRQDHQNNYPTLADFAAQFTESSTISGATAPIGTPGFPNGPYVKKMPINPFTGTDDLGNGPVGSSAWYYDGATGELLANDSLANQAY